MTRFREPDHPVVKLMERAKAHEIRRVEKAFPYWFIRRRNHPRAGEPVMRLPSSHIKSDAPFCRAEAAVWVAARTSVFSCQLVLAWELELALAKAERQLDTLIYRPKK